MSQVNARLLNGFLALRHLRNTSKQANYPEAYRWGGSGFSSRHDTPLETKTTLTSR